MFWHFFKCGGNSFGILVANNVQFVSCTECSLLHCSKVPSAITEATKVQNEVGCVHVDSVCEYKATPDYKTVDHTIHTYTNNLLELFVS